MKKLILIAVAIGIFSCETETDSDYTFQETTADSVARIFKDDTTPVVHKDISLFKGIIASYDLSLKGTILINLTDGKRYEAAARLHKGTSFVEEIYFKGEKHPSDSDIVIFESPQGTFDVSLSSKKEIMIEHFLLNESDSYITAYKKQRGAQVTLAFGTYQDDLDSSFQGNWDAIHLSSTYTSPAGGHSTAATTLLLLDMVVITRGMNMIVNSDNSSANDGFTEPCFYTNPDGTPLTVPGAWYYESQSNTYREFIAYNQTSTFGGVEASWSLAYYLFEGSFFYDTPTCGSSASAGYGSWSWNGRSGKIFVDTLVDN